MDYRELIDETGNKYHWLTVLERCDPPLPHIKQAYWLCRCECGNYTRAGGYDLRRDHYKSCGCYAVKRASEFANVDKKHPQRHKKRKHPAYPIWNGMIKACYSPTHNRYPSNGQKGRTVCSEWLNSADLFLQWMDSNGYTKGDSLYLEYEEKVYSPSTCIVISRGEAISKRRMKQGGINHEKYPGKEINGIKVISKLIDLERQKRISGNEWRTIKWLCECKCGKKCIKTTNCLTSTRELSCGCRNRVSGWSLKYKECINCKKTTAPYAAHGICRRCYFGLKKDPKYIPSERLDLKDKWAMNYDQCISCGTTEKKHHTHGYCVVCRQKKKDC